MKTIQVKKSFERFNVEIGDEVIACSIDCTDTKVNQMAAKAIKAKDQAMMLDAVKSKKQDAESLDEMSRKMADIIRPIIVGGIGEESYAAILTACGDGVELEPEQCNLVMVQVFATVVQAYVERLADVKESKAAHYLKDVVKNAQKADPEQ